MALVPRFPKKISKISGSQLEVPDRDTKPSKFSVPGWRFLTGVPSFLNFRLGCESNFVIALDFWSVDNRCHAKNAAPVGNPYEISRFLLRAPQPGTFLAGVPGWGRSWLGHVPGWGATHIILVNFGIHKGCYHV